VGCYLQWTVHSALLAGLEDRFVIRKSYVIPQSVIVIQHVLISIIPLPGAYVYMYRECVALVATSLLPDVDAAGFSFVTKFQDFAGFELRLRVPSFVDNKEKPHRVT